MKTTRSLALLAVGLLAGSATGLAPPFQGSNDCSTATPLAGLGSFAFDTSTATTGVEGQNEANCNASGTTGIDRDVWFTWTAPATGTATVALCGSAAFDTKIAAYPGSSCPADGTSLACNDDQCGLQSSISFAVTSGNSYVLQLGSFPGSPGGAGTLTISLPPPPVTIAAGSDFWNTPGLGCTYQDFTATPIPAGFFGTGSVAYTGYVAFVGQPLTGTGLVGGVDTIVERLAGASVPTCPSVDTIPLRILALSMKSFRPINIQFPSSTSKYEVVACLSSSFPQLTGSMTIRREHINGGTFDSTLPVRPKLIFNKVSGSAGLATVVMDSGATITFQNPPSGSGVPGCWAFTDGGLGIPGSLGGTVDHDCDPSPNVPFPATTPNFYGGVCFPGADCNTPGGPVEPMLTKEATVLARHCILPIALPPGNMPYCFCPVDDPPYPPCANPDPDAGCMNSTGNGALMTFSGIPDVSADTLGFLGTGLPPSQPVLLFQGLQPAIGQFGGGHLCLTGGIKRMGVSTANSLGTVTRGFPNGESIAVLGQVPLAGDLRYYQFWYRNTAGPCGGFNLTNALQIDWIP